MKKLLTLITLLFCFSQPALAAKWDTLTERTVTYKADTDRVLINPYKRDLQQVRLKSKQGMINMDSITLHFRDGSKIVEDNLGTLFRGQTSRSINVPRRQARNLVMITFKYKAIGNRKTDNIGLTNRGIVEIQGKRR
ncbi:hypothetical protein [Thaumasiovibrio subtropicus]|uniref:hypothetical protein n=1 Tax=Thaumasiovibrio subtropicus TaxID=1891207 RepID=UPI000B35EFB3|nr:hypothetical protein [Thaumasiovibrio subtropicus]